MVGRGKREAMLNSWLSSSWGRIFLAGVVALLIIAILAVLRDPFDFDDRPHIERLMKLALANVQGDTAVDMEERMWAQVKVAETGNLSRMSAPEWEVTSKWFLAHNTGYIGLYLLDETYHQKRTATLPEAAGLDTVADVLSEARLQELLQTAVTSTSRVAVAPCSIPNGRLGYLIAVPDYAQGEIVGFLVVMADIEKTLDSMLSEFKGLRYSVAVSDSSRQLYQSGTSEHRKSWGQSAKVPLPAVDWQVEAWPKPEMLADTQSPFLELVAIFTTLLILLLASTIHFGRMLQAKSVALQRAHDGLERRVEERTAELRQMNDSLRDLSLHVLHVQDEERRRIARELHDSTAQALSGLQINISTILNQTTFDLRVLRPILQQSRMMAEQALDEIRTMSHLLHPPILEDFGLASALAWYAAGFSERSGIHTRVEIDPDLGRFTQDLELILFRVVQEALGNIHRHSGSAVAEVILSRTLTAIRLLVRDEGCGLPEHVLDPERGTVPRIGVGIAGMRERIRQFDGTLEIVSSKSGTTLTVILPISERQKDVPQDAKQFEDSL
jgi:signal transduction histidine kinase